MFSVAIIPFLFFLAFIIFYHLPAAKNNPQLRWFLVVTPFVWVVLVAILMQIVPRSPLVLSIMIFLPLPFLTAFFVYCSKNSKDVLNFPSAMLWCLLLGSMLCATFSICRSWQSPPSSLDSVKTDETKVFTPSVPPPYKRLTLEENNTIDKSPQQVVAPEE
jgi:hypothetical protein